MKKSSQGVEQIQLVVRAGLELRISRFQVRRPNHSSTLPPIQVYYRERVSFRRKERRPGEFQPYVILQERKTKLFFRVR